MSWMVDSTRTDRWKEIDLELLRVREWIICTHLNIEMRNDWLFQRIESRTRSGRRSEGGGKRGKDSWREIVWGNNTKQLTGKIFIPGLCTHTNEKSAIKSSSSVSWEYFASEMCFISHQLRKMLLSQFSYMKNIIFVLKVFGSKIPIYSDHYNFEISRSRLVLNAFCDREI